MYVETFDAATSKVSECYCLLRCFAINVRLATHCRVREGA